MGLHDVVREGRCPDKAASESCIKAHLSFGVNRKLCIHRSGFSAIRREELLANYDPSRIMEVASCREKELESSQVEGPYKHPGNLRPQKRHNIQVGLL